MVRITWCILMAMPKNLSRLSFTQKQKIARKNRQKLKTLTRQIRNIQASKMTKSQAKRMNKLIAKYIKFKQTARYV